MAQVSQVRRRVLGALAVLGLTAGAGIVGTGPASAGAPAPSADAMVHVPYAATSGMVVRNGTKVPFTSAATASASAGQFRDAAGGDVFLYNPGSGADGVLHIVPTGGGSTTTSFTPVPISGSFRPIVGDFDGNTIDDIIWYAPGSAPDYLWQFDPSGGHTSKTLSITATYRPVVLDANGDEIDDLIFYGPGTQADAFWIFNASGGHTTKAISIGGDYQPFVGPFGLAAEGQPTDRVVWFNPAGADYIWTFTTSAGHSSFPLPNIDGSYQPLVGQFIEESYGTIFWYRPGSGVEHLWAFGPPANDVSEQEVDQVNGTYVPQVGDFDDNGLSDIAWTSGTTTRYWKYQFTGKKIETVVSGLPSSAIPISVHMD
jgi:hypothetical protein